MLIIIIIIIAIIIIIIIIIIIYFISSYLGCLWAYVLYMEKKLCIQCLYDRLLLQVLLNCGLCLFVCEIDLTSVIIVNHSVATKIN